MSKGIGGLQSAILSLVRTRGAEGIPANEVMWSLAREDTGRLQPDKKDASHRAISDAFYRNFRRAAQGLRRRGKLVNWRRPLGDVKDLCRLYPWETRSERVLLLRDDLLPFVERYLGELAGSRRFSAADNERHSLASLPPEERLALEQEWLALEPRLYPLLSQTEGAPRTSLLGVIVRGQQLLGGNAWMSHRSSLRDLILSLSWMEQGNFAEIGAELRSFAERVFPEREVRRTRLKTQLYRVVDIRLSSRRPTLVKEFKDYLLDHARATLEAMPDHRGSAPLHLFADDSGDTEYSPLLDDLLGRDVGGEVEFFAAAPPCFQALKLSWPCDAAAVKKSFRKLALDTHPDRGGTETTFIAVKSAHDAALAYLDLVVIRTAARSVGQEPPRRPGAGGCGERAE